MKRFPTVVRALTALLLLLAVPAAAHADGPNPVVLVETPLGSFEIELFPDDAPQTVENFLRYIEDGAFENSFIHRSVRNFVLQGGGFVFGENGARPVETRAPIPNEFKRSNVRGTIAMAKAAGDPNSARSQWFINLADNSANLDSQNGGFTVFGQVVGGGMAVVDALAAVRVFNLGGNFTELPLRDFTSGQVRAENLLFTQMSISSSVPAPLLLRHSGNGSWFSYRLGASDTSARIDEKGKVKLSRVRSLSTVARGDFDGSGEPDVLLRDASDPDAVVWRVSTLNGRKVLEDGVAALPADDAWKVVGAGDADGDGKDDVLLRNDETGAWKIFLMSGTTIRNMADLPLSTDLGDAFAGMADFDGDGKVDVLLRRANGTWLQYLLDGTGTPKTGKPKLSRSGKDTVAAIADFDGDRDADVLLRNTNGKWTIYLLDGAKVRMKGALGLPADTDVTLAAAGDFSGDGAADALLRDAAGAWQLFAIEGRKILAQGSVEITEDLAYTVVTVDDYNGDGRVDVLLRSTNGKWLLYTLDGTVPEVLLETVPKLQSKTAWEPQLD